MQNEFLYKVVVRRELLSVQKFKVNKITEKTITIVGKYSKHRIPIEDLESLLVEDKSTEAAINASYIYTFDQSKISTMQISVLEHFISRMEKKAQEYTNIIDNIEYASWNHQTIEMV